MGKQNKQINWKKIALYMVVIITVFEGIDLLIKFTLGIYNSVIQDESTTNMNILSVHIDIVNILLSIVSIITMLIVGYLAYKVSRQQAKISEKQLDHEYNRTVCNSATLVSLHIRFKLLLDIDNLLVKNKHLLDDSFDKEVLTESTQIWNLDFEIDKEFPKIISYYNDLCDDDFWKKCFLCIYLDIIKKNNILYIFEDEFVNYEEDVIKLTSTKKWLEIKKAIFNDDLETLNVYLKEDYYKVLLKINELSTPR